MSRNPMPDMDVFGSPPSAPKDGAAKGGRSSGAVDPLLDLGPLGSSSANAGIGGSSASAGGPLGGVTGGAGQGGAAKSSPLQGGSSKETGAVVPRLAEGEAADADTRLFNNLKPMIQVIDDLRDVGLQQYIDLPRIVAIGSQSSGKSSVIGRGILF